MIKVRGIAVIPSIYESEGGSDVQLRPIDIDSAINDYSYNKGSMVPFVDMHDESLQGGVTTALWNSSDGLWFESVIYDDSIEDRVRAMIASGMVPNVSLKIQPSTDKGYAREYNGGMVTFFDEWEIIHLSLVEHGRCSQVEGCGIFEIIDGDMVNMDEDKLVVKLEADVASKDAEAIVLNARIGKLEDSIAVLTASRDEYKATIDATEASLTLAANAKTDELRAEIIAIDSEAQVSGISDHAALELVLAAIQSKPAPKGKGSGDGGDIKSDATLRLEAAIEARSALG